jgi:hypothetical protein
MMSMSDESALSESASTWVKIQKTCTITQYVHGSVFTCYSTIFHIGYNSVTYIFEIIIFLSCWSNKHNTFSLSSYYFNKSIFCQTSMINMIVCWNSIQNSTLYFTIATAIVFSCLRLSCVFLIQFVLLEEARDFKMSSPTAASVLAVHDK